MKQLVMETTILKGSEVAKQRYETGLIPDVKNFEMEVVNLYPQKTYQTIEGFGAALTESAGYALSRMSEENFERVVQALLWRGRPRLYAGKSAYGQLRFFSGKLLCSYQSG